MKAYIASPFFNDKQLNDVKRVERACEKAYWNYYSPRLGHISKFYNELDPTKSEDADVLDLYKRMVFMEDIIEIDTSDVVFVNYNGKDSGTLFELGYAIAKRKRIIPSSSDASERKEFLRFLNRVKDLISDIPENNNLMFCHGDAINSCTHDLDPSTMVVIAEHELTYTGISKVLLGYLYALSEERKELDVIYVDVPRKSNLMLTGSSQVYECKDLSVFSSIAIPEAIYPIRCMLDEHCSPIKDSKDE